jgi:hypothetical protein
MSSFSSAAKARRKRVGCLLPNVTLIGNQTVDDDADSLAGLLRVGNRGAREEHSRRVIETANKRMILIRYLGKQFDQIVVDVVSNVGIS